MNWRGQLRKALFAMLVAWLFAPVATATVDPFYLESLRRGLAHFDAGDYPSAASELRVGAFGAVDSLDLFEIAHIYAAVASANVKDEADARRSAQRVVAAERINRTYARLKLPNHVRTQFEAVAKAALPSNEYTFLMANGSPADGTVMLPASVIAAGSASPPPVTQQQPVVPAPVPQKPAPVAPAPKRSPPPAQPPSVQPRDIQPPIVRTPAPQPPPAQRSAAQPSTTTNPPVIQPSAAPPASAPPSPAPAIPVQRPASAPPSGTDGQALTRKSAGDPDSEQPPATMRTTPAPTPPTPQADPAPPRKTGAASGSLADASRALAAGDLAAARAIYNARLDAAQIGHAELLEIGAGLYRSRDFQGAARAFNRVGVFAKGEEPYRYYFAVALYETGRYADAKRELKAALPFIEATPDVVRYRAQIEGAIN